MKHVTEATLGFLALDPELVPNLEEVEAHIGECGECRDTLEAIREYDSKLKEPETWINVEAKNELRRYTVRMAGEDAAAAAALKKYEDPAASARFVFDHLPNKPAFRNGGVARRLCRMANGMCDRQPLYALALAEAATRIALALPARSYPPKAIHELRGESFKEQANAFYRLGQFARALTALDNAQEEYRKLPYEGIGIAAVKYVRAGVLAEQDRFGEAETLALESAAVALHLGDTERYMRARHQQGHIRFLQQQFAQAAEVFADVLAYGEKENNLLWIARESLNVAGCYVELGRICEASDLLSRAQRLFGELQLTSEIPRTNWTIARMLFAQGHPTEAIYKLRTVVQEMTNGGMLTDAAIAAVHLAEMLHAANRGREIPKLLSGVVRTLIDAGQLSGALTALAYLRDSSAAGPVQPAVFSYVCRFLSRTERQPELVFAPPRL